MQFLQELLLIDKSTYFENLLEDLGNLKQLKLGSLANTFKQTFNTQTHRKVQHSITSETGKKFTRYSGIGRDSAVIDLPTQIFKWSQVKKAIINGEQVLAVAFKLNDKSVALLIANADDVRNGKNTVGVSWDLTKTGLTTKEMDEVVSSLSQTAFDSAYGIDNIVANKMAGKSEHDTVMTKFLNSWEQKEELEKLGRMGPMISKETFTDYEDWSDILRAGGAKLDKSGDVIIATVNSTTVGEWNKENKKGFLVRTKEVKRNPNVAVAYTKPKHYAGITQTVAQTQSFIEALAKQGILTISTISLDSKAQNTRKERNLNQPVTLKDVESFKADLRERLIKFKNSKVETVEDAAAFMKKVFEGSLKKVTLAGVTYFTQADTTSGYTNNKSGSYSNSMMKDLLSKKPVSVYFSSADGKYNTLSLVVKLVDGMLTPVSASYYKMVDGSRQRTTETF